MSCRRTTAAVVSQGFSYGCESTSTCCPQGRFTSAMTLHQSSLLIITRAKSTSFGSMATSSYVQRTWNDWCFPTGAESAERKRLTREILMLNPALRGVGGGRDFEQITAVTRPRIRRIAFLMKLLELQNLPMTGQVVPYLTHLFPLTLKLKINLSMTWPWWLGFCGSKTIDWKCPIVRWSIFLSFYGTFLGFHVVWHGLTVFFQDFWICLDLRLGPN